MLFEMTEMAKEKEDSSTIKMLGHIEKVPKHVKDAVLRHFVRKCKEMHSIAFMQWRLKFPQELTFDKKEIEKLVFRRINHFYETLCDH